MIGITEINKEISQKTKKSESEVKLITASFLEAVRQKLVKGEVIGFREYFTLQRAKHVPKISKFCDKHNKSMDDYKRINKEEGIKAFSKNSPDFQKLQSQVDGCSNCKAKKQLIDKQTKLLTRIVCRTPNKEFWKVPSSTTSPGRKKG